MKALAIDQLVETLRSFLSPADAEALNFRLGVIRSWGGAEQPDEKQVLAARMFEDMVDQIPFSLTAEQRIEMDLQLLHFYEGMAEKGNAFAMRCTAFAYARGDCHQVAIHQDNGYSIRAYPDYELAAFWCRRAVAAGDDVAARALESIERDLERSRNGPQNPPPAPPAPQP